MPSPPPSPRLNRMLCFAIYSAGHAFTRVYKPKLDKLGLTYPQFLVLTVLWDQDKLTLKEIGERLFLDSGTLTPLIKRLEAAGLVHRERDTADERHVRVSLAEQGCALEEQASFIMPEMVCALARPEEQLLALTDEIAELRATLRERSSV